MSTTKAILDDAELAKSYITGSTMSDQYKRAYLRLINISTMATNGITQEEKIQKMTECIQLLAITQGMYLASIDSKIELAIDKANANQCHDCKAMKHAKDIEREKHDQVLIDSYLKKLGINKNQTIKNQKPTEQTWTDVCKTILIKPYIYAVFCLMIISPYGVDIVKTLCEFFGK